MPGAIIFPCEDVLIDTRKQSARAWEEMCKQWVPDRPLTDEDLRALDGLHIADALTRLIDTHFTRRELPDAVKLRAEMQHHAVTEFPLEPVPSAVDLLNRLDDQHVAFAVTSSFVLDQLLFQLQKTGLLNQCNMCIGSDEVEHGPPAPDQLLEAAHRLGVQPATCVTVQSTPFGIEAGHAAGMHVVGLTASYTEPELSHAHRVITDLNQLADDLARTG